jgi:SAM-dependent methyltransferase
MPSPNGVESRRTLHADELEQWLLNALHVRPGNTILELAAGAGELCVHLAERVRPGGATICSDLDPRRVAEAAWRAAERGASDVSARVIDMLRIDLPDESVDGVLCRWGYMFAVPPDVALDETFRVLRTGRRIALSVWGHGHRNPWMSLVDDAFAAEGHAVQAHRTAPGRMFSLAEADTLRALLTGAGFVEIVLKEIPVDFEYADSDAHWNEEARYPGGPFTGYLDGLQSQQVSAVRARLDLALAPFRMPLGGYRIPGLTLNATARRAIG